MVAGASWADDGVTTAGILLLGDDGVTTAGILLPLGDDGIATPGVVLGLGETTLALGDGFVSFGSESWQPERNPANVRLIIPKPTVCRSFNFHC
ncbi:MAG: hypothetical protein U7123_13600 [Potamolinea sp.]